MNTTKRGQAGGLAVKAKYGDGYLRTIASEGGKKTVATYGISFMCLIGSAGGMVTAARNRRRLYDSGVTMASCLGGD